MEVAKKKKRHISHQWSLVWTVNIPPMWCNLWTGTSLIQQIASCQCLLCFDCSRSLHKKRAKGLVDQVICTGKEMGPLPHLLSEVVWGASMTFQCKFKWYVWVWSGRISMQNLLDVSGMVFKASRWWRLQKGTCYGACFCFCFFFLPRLPSSCSLQLKSMAQAKATCRTGSCNSITQPEMHCAHLHRPQAYRHGHCTTIPEGLTVSHHSQHPEAKLSIFSSMKRAKPPSQLNH